jgi:hypothetical protein
MRMASVCNSILSEGLLKWALRLGSKNFRILHAHIHCASLGRLPHAPKLLRNAFFDAGPVPYGPDPVVIDQCSILVGIYPTAHGQSPE